MPDLFKPPPSAKELNEAGASLQQAERLRQGREFSRAQAICEGLVRKYPDYMGALHTLGLVFGDQNNYDAALGCLVRAVMLNPHSWPTLTALAGAHLRLGAVEQARQAI